MSAFMYLNQLHATCFSWCTSLLESCAMEQEGPKITGIPSIRWRFIESSMEFSLNGAELSLNSGNSENLRNHWGMNWVQHNDLLSYNCLCGTVVESLSLTQEILGTNPAIFLFDFNFFVTEFSEFSESI